MAHLTVKISDTARAMLTLAATDPDRLVRPPRLPAAAASNVVRSLLNNGFVEEVPAPIEDAEYHWRTDDDGVALMLRATDKGLEAIGAAAAPTAEPQTIETFAQAVVGFLAEESCNATILDEAEAKTIVADGFANGRPPAAVAGDILTWLAETEEQAEEAADAANAGAPGADTADEDTVAREAAAVADALDAAPPRATLRAAAQGVLNAWADEANRSTDVVAALEGPMATLRAVLGERGPRTTTVAPRKPREGTKQAQVVAMLRRPEGATVAQIAEAMNWAPHTVRGFFAGLKKRQGIVVEVADRVRQFGAGKDGSKGSYTIYRIAN